MPARVIRHGILAARDKRLMGQISEAGIVLAMPDLKPAHGGARERGGIARDTFRAFAKCDVQFTIATDGREMMRTHLRDEFELLLRIGTLDESHLSEANRRGHEASFVQLPA